MNKDTALKVALWIIPCVFGCGGFVAMMQSSTTGLSADVSEVEARLEAHEDLKAHPVTEARLDVLVEEQRTIRTEQRQMNENLTAVCVATGARCK